MMNISLKRLFGFLAFGFLWFVTGVPAAFATDVTAEQLTPMVTAHVREKIRNRQAGYAQSTGETSPVTSDKAAVNETIAISVLQVPGAPFHFPGQSTVRITLNSAAWEQAWSDRGIVRVRLEDDAGHSRELGVPVAIRIQKPVWVVRQPVSANAPLRAIDFTRAVRDVSLTYETAIGAEKPLNAYVARVNLNPGETLDIRKIAIPPDVRYNDDIRILFRHDNGMTLSLPGVALANGRIGQTIRVRQNLYRRQYYNARVIDRNQVLVEM
jgi:flagella basal body P-ring formation protein FlgA